ncbi:MAG: serine/threonine-protein kinase [Myxococcota bacterium]
MSGSRPPIQRLPADLDPEETHDTTMRGDAYFGSVERLLRGEQPRLVMGKILGRGSMGIVRAGEQTALGREVAVKAPRTDDPEDVGSILQEAWVAGALEHPNIVPVYDIHVIDGRPHVIMKKIEGVAWSTLINDATEVKARFGRDDPLVWNLEVLVSVCNAVEYAHDHGVLHRDLKPSNVLIGRYGEVWVMDWGIAVSLTEAHRDRLPLAYEQRGITGTPAYMAPEMAEGDGTKLTERADIYLLGALLYRIIAGKPPHTGNDVEAVYKALFKPTTIDSHWPLADLLASSLAKDPEHRPPSVAEFRAAVQRYLSRRGAQALVRSASAKLDALRTVAGVEHPEDSAAHRFALYDLYSACRFGFQQALEASEAVDEARDGLREATEMMVRYELRQGDDRAAHLLLKQLPDAPSELRDAVAEVRERRKRAKARLERLEEDNDPRTAWVARLMVFSAVGAVWALTPITSALLGIPKGYLRELAISGGTFFLTGVLLTLLAPWLVKSRLNRIIIVLVALGPGLAFILNVGCWLYGADSELSGTIELFVYFMLAMIATLIAEWRLFVGTLAFLAAFLLAMANEGTTLLWMNIANVILAVNGIVIWLPLGWRRNQAHRDTPLL